MESFPSEIKLAYSNMQHTMLHWHTVGERIFSRRSIETFAQNISNVHILPKHSSEGASWSNTFLAKNIDCSSRWRILHDITCKTISLNPYITHRVCGNSRWLPERAMLATSRRATSWRCIFVLRTPLLVFNFVVSAGEACCSLCREAAAGPCRCGGSYN